MKTLFERQDRQEILDRVCKLQPQAYRRWGTMEPAQMLAHCTGAIAMASGKLNLPRAFLGRVLGPLFRPMFVGEKEFRRNGPTSPALVVSDQREFETERTRLMQSLGDFGEGGRGNCTRHPHPFFGDLTPEEWGIVMYKHLDHHLRQFGG